MDYFELLSFGLLGDMSNLNHKERVDFFKKYLKDFFEIDLSSVVLRSPTFFQDYQNYISKDKEDIKMYYTLKDKIRDIFGKDVVTDMLNHTRFLYQTKTLVRKKLSDEISTETLPY